MFQVVDFPHGVSQVPFKSHELCSYIDIAPKDLVRIGKSRQKVIKMNRASAGSYFIVEECNSSSDGQDETVQKYIP